MANSKPSPTRVYILGALLLLLIIGAIALLLSTLGVLNIRMDRSGGPTSQSTTMPLGPTPTPTPTRLNPGKETYSIGQWSGAKGPGIPTLTLDPLDPKLNQQQHLSVHVNYDQPVTAVSIEVQSDNKTKTLPLVLTGGSDTNGDWSIDWTVDDTVLYKYILNVSATGNGVTNTVTVAPRS